MPLRYANEFRYVRPLIPGAVALIAMLALQRAEVETCAWFPAFTDCEDLGPWWLPITLSSVTVLSVVLSVYYYWRDFLRVDPPTDWEDTHWRHD